MPQQLNQIDTMDNILSTPNIHNSILKEIYSNKYIDEVTNQGMIYKCNLFTDDMLKKYYKLELPRRGDFAENFRMISSSVPISKDQGLTWPSSAAPTDIFFNESAKFRNSGISKLDPMSAVDLASKGFPIVVGGRGHSTLLAPSKDGIIRLYSPNYKKHSEKNEPAITGVKNPSDFNYYSIDRTKYFNYINTLRKNKVPFNDVWNIYKYPVINSFK